MTTNLEVSAEDERSAKIALADKLNALIKERALRQVEVAQITGLIQSKVSHIRHHNLQNISLERLMHALVSLDQHVEITVSPAGAPREAGITVTQ